MNSIALLESIALDKSKIGSFTKEEYTEIKKQLVAQKETDATIEDSDIAQLLKALKSHPDAFRAVLNNRILFNFFTKTDYPRGHFLSDAAPVENDKVKAFVGLFLADELTDFFNQNLEADKFEPISSLAEAKDYFPDTLVFSLKQHALDKLDAAIAALKPPYGNFSKILYIRDAHFFTFLNNIKDSEIEAKMEDFLTVIKEFYSHNHGSELASRTFAAMSKYSPIDSSLSEKIKSVKNIADHNPGIYIPKKKNLTWVYVAVGIFVLVRIIIFINVTRFNNHNNDYDNQVTYDDETEYSPDPPKIDPYYTNMKFAIDSFQTFLTNFKQTEIKQMTRETSLKTGENPFQTFYQNPPTGDSNHFIKVTNKTGYDMVLLENSVLYDSIKMPRTAHFIKAGDALEINFKSSDAETIFNMYLGKKWATFQTDKNLFIRNNSVVEYRFSELLPEAKEVLKTDYSLVNNAVVSYSHGALDIVSKDARINPLKKQ